ncbi:hypothetical protein EXE08_16460 [Acinetobacter pittii]|uniref:hypothetical protein n=1 Tax=Acinetobacter pittii TaxID=48296 RepID=UPI001023571C|nr:hypothetical protein [Acinetobacter pittii]RZG91684.1 hypothetical protein EXE08_16460 [Acinetobacter pittii]
MDNYKEYLNPKDGYALVKSSIDMPVHHTWIEIPAGATTAIYYVPTKKVYFWKGEDVHWDTGEWMDCKAAQLTTVTEFLERNESRIVWKRTTQDPALISGDVALANVHKCIVQYLHDDEPYGRWTTITDHFWSQYNLGMFLDPDTKFKFRFKPQTIKLELELPKPFEPKDGDEYFYISTLQNCLYSHDVWSDEPADITQAAFGAYRTEDDVKKAVEQLRKIRGANS